MQAFTRHSGLAVPLLRANVDTDAIIPKQFLKAIGRSGFGPFLFDAWRYADGGGEPGQDCRSRPKRADFVLNRPRYQGASILLAGDNFGCGSSREHAAWAMVEYGFRAVIAASFAEIFHGNAVTNGLLPIALNRGAVTELAAACEASPGYRLLIDLQTQTITTPEERTIAFSIAPDVRERLLHGLDDIELTLQHVEAVRTYQRRRAAITPWLFQK